MGRRRKYSDSTPSSPTNSAAKRARVKTSPSATVHSSAAITWDTVVPIFNAIPSAVFVSPVADFSSADVPPSTARVSSAAILIATGSWAIEEETVAKVDNAAEEGMAIFETNATEGTAM